MSTDILTQGPTEADLEAKIHSAIRMAFPLLPANSLQHQTRFAFRIGRTEYRVDGTKTAEGRTDILVYFRDQPLAVLKLKREGLELSPDDEQQGLSYAKVMTPIFPLVVVSNGPETRIFATYSCELLAPQTLSEAEFAKIVTAAGRAATNDLKQAISTLLGTNPAIWVTAVRAASEAHVEEMSGAWDDPSRPFVRDFLFPRKATAITLYLLQGGRRFVMVEGAPLVGKSSLLRELVRNTSDSPDFAVLFVPADHGHGIIQAVADLLSAELSWPVTAEEARQWLLRISKAGSPGLVLAIDGVGPDHDAVRHEIEDLCSGVFGPQLRLVVTADDAVATRLTTHTNSRQASPIGRRVDGRVFLSLLDDEEFNVAANALWDKRMGLQHGAALAPELRVPWMLRALGGIYAPGAEDPENRAAVLPPLLSLDLIHHARERFLDSELRRVFRKVAQAVLRDVEDAALPLALKLEAMSTFVVRRETLDNYLDRADINNLMAQGFLKDAIHASGEPVLFVRPPEFLASEASIIIANQLMARAKDDAEDAAKWLTRITASIPLGDIVAAHAFLDVPSGPGGVPLAVVQAMANHPPRVEPITGKVRTAAHFPGVGMVELTFEGDGSFTAEVNGKRKTFTTEETEEQNLLADIHPWLILSHLAGRQMVFGEPPIRLDLELLGLLGSCQHVLRRPEAFMEGSAIPMHEVRGYGEVICHAAGIAEPVTLSIFKMLSHEGPEQEEWIKRALANDSLALLARIDIALREITKLADLALRHWAAELRRNRIGPALREAIACAAE